MAKKTYIPRMFDLAKELKDYIDRWSVNAKANMDNGGPAEMDELRASLVQFLDVTREYVELNP